MSRITPVPCPECGESQNVFKGRFDPDQQPFGDVTCMVCGHEFEQCEYQQLLSQAQAAPLGPMSDQVRWN